MSVCQTRELEVSEQAEAEEESLQLYDLASSILVDCKQTAHVSELNNAVWLLSEALTLRPAPHIHRPDSLDSLADALIARFWHVGPRNDLEQAVSLRTESLMLRGGGLQPFVCRSAHH
jgi:hypothetical protein